MVKNEKKKKYFESSGGQPVCAAGHLGLLLRLLSALVMASKSAVKDGPPGHDAMTSHDLHRTAHGQSGRPGVECDPASPKYAA